MQYMTKGARKWAPGVLNVALFWSMITVMPLFAQEMTHAHQSVTPQLVADVRKATQQFINVNNAGTAGYTASFGCIAGPDHGAMGIHYINGDFVNDGQININQPEALIYEPVGNARRLVGVEYIVDAKSWLMYHDNTPPVLEGQDFQFVPAPNRFNLNSFFELHVWAWRGNPQGAFVDWNNNVSCEHQ